MVFISGSYSKACVSYNFYNEFYHKAIIMALQPQHLLPWLQTMSIICGLSELVGLVCVCPGERHVTLQHLPLHSVKAYYKSII